jgi:membrane-bound lytic murein transglycosylase D
MSFRFGGAPRFSARAAAGATDSTASTSAKTLANLLSDPVTENEIAIKGLFKMNPAVKPFLKDFTRKESEEFSAMKIWGKPCFSMMDEVLASNGLPVQLKYLAVIESNLKPGTVSHSGATGPWQLMPAEGRMFGLTMQKGNDERKDFRKSTEVAAILLKNLYNEFGDWLLAVGAYNCGNGAMRRAIAKAGSRNYWVVEKYLSAQARNHVKKYIATHYIFEGCGGWTTITSTEAAECRAAIACLNAGRDSAAGNTGTIEIRGKYNAAIMSEALMIDKAFFNRLNPGFEQTLLEGKVYQLTLPAGKMPLFIANKKQILEQSVQLLLSQAAG